MDTTSLRWRARNTKTSVSEIETSLNNDDNNNTSIESKKIKGLCCEFNWVDGLATGAVTSSILAIQRHNLVAKIAAGSTLILGPYAAYQKRQLGKLGTLRRQQNRLRETANIFQAQNEMLHRKTQNLNDVVSNLESVQNELALYVNDRSELKRLQEVVSRQNHINRQIMSCMRKQIMQNILEVVVTSDSNRNFDIEGGIELERLIYRMKAIPGVTFHEQNFRKLLSSSGTLKISRIMSIIRQLMADDDESNDIFTMKPESLTTVKPDL